MMTTQKIHLATAVVLALGLTACGGGSRDANISPTAADASAQEVPPSAISSTASFLEYQNSLQQQASDTVEALTLQNMLPPSDDTIEPSPLL